MKNAANERKGTEDALRRENTSLELRVAERTAQIELMNKELVEERARFSRAADAAGIGFWEYDLASRQFHWDDRMYRLYGRERGAVEPCYDQWVIGLHPEDRARVEQEFVHAATSSLPCESEFRILHPNGEVRHIAASFTVHRETDLAGAQLIGTNIDITARHRAIERLAERTAALAATNSELAHKNEEVEAFVYIVSHDLRSPLVNLQGFAHELERSCGALTASLRAVQLDPLTDKAVQTILQQDVPGALRYISASTTKFEHLIDALLLLSRTGRQELRLESVDVQAIVQSTLLSLSQSIKLSAASIHVDALPAIIADTTGIGQVFSNLIGNALKYAHPGRPPQISIGGEVVGALTHYWVTDNGAGIALNSQPRLFQVFQRFHPELAGGEGMGLAIVKRVVERHGGRIWAESVEGVGTTFHLNLPAGIDARAA